MFIFNVLVFLFVVAGGFWFSPICLGKDLQLKNQSIIKGLSIANMAAFVVGIVMLIAGLIKGNWALLSMTLIPLAVFCVLSAVVYIIIARDVKQDRIFDNGIVCDHVLWNARNHIYQNDMFGWGIYVILYILELLAVFMPVINLDSKTTQTTFNLFNFYQFNSATGVMEEIGVMNNITGVFMIMANISAYVLLAVAVIGILLHIIVRDTRKTVFFDCILQGVYVTFTFAVSFVCFAYDNVLSELSVNSYNVWGPATLFMPLIVGVTMLIAVLPQNCSLMLARSE